MVVQAATLELNSGQIVKGQIVHQDEDSYKLDTGIGFPVTYFVDEIKSIDGEPVSPVTAREPLAPGPLETEEISEDTSANPPRVEPSLEPAEQAIPTAPPAIPEQSQADNESVDDSFGPADVIDLDGIPAVETPTDQGQGPMSEIISKEINQMMLRNKTPNEPTAPVLRSGPMEVYKDMPAEDLTAVEIKPVSKEHPSPFGPTVKPREDLGKKVESGGTPSAEGQLITEVIGPPTPGPSKVPHVRQTGGFKGYLWTTVDDLIARQKLRLIFAQEEYAKKWPVIKEKLHQLPVSVRRDILLIFLCLTTIVYIFVCYPFMNIARRLGRKHSWLVWIPFVQWVYYVHVAGKSLWWSVMFLVPVVNYFLVLLLFVDILKALKKSFWIIILIILPGINIFTLWYLAISQTLEAEIRP